MMSQIRPFTAVTMWGSWRSLLEMLLMGSPSIHGCCLLCAPGFCRDTVQRLTECSSSQLCANICHLAPKVRFQALSNILRKVVISCKQLAKLQLKIVTSTRTSPDSLPSNSSPQILDKKGRKRQSPSPNLWLFTLPNQNSEHCIQLTVTAQF